VTHVFQQQSIPESWQAAWNEHKQEELSFWEWWLLHKGDSGHMAEDYAQRVDARAPLQDIVSRRLTGPAHILDVGTGPLTWLGKQTAFPIAITAVDPLADEYNALLHKYNVMPLVRTKPVAGERLAFEFPHNHFDVVFARNALDHAVFPAYIIDQMLAVCKPGGWVGMEHCFAEGTRRGTGLHTWDVLLDPDMQMVIERPGGDHSVNLAERYSGLVVFQTEVRQLPGFYCWASCWMKKMVATS
jgi:SAM-dependent methyltransferase